MPDFTLTDQARKLAVERFAHEGAKDAVIVVTSSSEEAG
jgi:hypothetical protein